MRAHTTPEQLVAARAIESRLYAQPWQDPDYDLASRTRDIRAPALLLHGEYDLIPIPLAEQVADALPYAELEVLPDCGHFAYVDAPELVAQRTAAFLGPSPR